MEDVGALILNTFVCICKPLTQVLLSLLQYQKVLLLSSSQHTGCPIEKFTSLKGWKLLNDFQYQYVKIKRIIAQTFWYICKRWENFLTKFFCGEKNIFTWFSQNLTKFGKSGFFERKKHFVKKFSHSFQTHQNVHAVIFFILTYSYWKSVEPFKSFLNGH